MPKVVDREQVRALLAEGAQLIDVLPADEYAEEHIAGATNIPLRTIGTTSVARLDRARPVITYCHDGR